MKSQHLAPWYWLKNNYCINNSFSHVKRNVQNRILCSNGRDRKIFGYFSLWIREKSHVMTSDCWPWPNLELFFLDWRQFPKNFGKLGTIFRFVIPAPLHNLVDLIWTLLWAQHSVTCIHSKRLWSKLWQLWIKHSWECFT